MAGLALPAQAEVLVISSVTVQDQPADAQFAASGASVKITWLTNQEATGRVEFGLTDAYGLYVQSTDTPSRLHEVTLSSLKGETTYHFRLIAEAPGQVPFYSFDQTFRTSRFVSTVKPVVSDVHVTFTGGTYFIVTWVTDKPSDSGVDFSLSRDMSWPGGAGGNRDTTQHEVIVGGLRTGTTYYAVAHSTDGDGNVGTGSGFVVTTTATDLGDKAPLVLSQVSPVSWPDSRISATSITFTWHTNQPSRGTVDVRGPGGKRVDETGFLSTEHTVNVLNLQPNTAYLVNIGVGDIFRQGAGMNDIALHTAPEVALPQVTYTVPTPRVLGAACTNPNAYGAPCRDLGLERKLAAELNVTLKRYFHGRVPQSARDHWFELIRACAYGHYPAQAIIQAVRFGGKTVHPSIPWARWKTTSDYQAYINR